jgi:hypothetical protein
VQEAQNAAAENWNSHSVNKGVEAALTQLNYLLWLKEF